MAKILFIIAQNGFQQVEYHTPKNILESSGNEVVTASLKKGRAVAKDGSTTPVELGIDEANVGDYDGIYLIGGPGALADLDNERVYAIVREAKQQGKPYGAICISPRILAKAGVLVDVKATGHNADHALPDILEDNGATFVDETVVHDGNVITATGPEAAEGFGREIARVFQQ